jgi:hypothetical protein
LALLGQGVEEKIMADELTIPRPQDVVVSVGTRISWGAIFAGALLALGLYSLFTVLGGAVGLSISDRMNPSTLKTGAIVWTLIILLVSIFVGGVVISQFTVGETKTEALLYGVIMWALLFAILAGLGAAGARAGIHAMAGMVNFAETTTAQTWDKLAREAGVPADQIETWRRKTGAPERTNQEPQEGHNQEATKEAATRIAWYTFGGTWASMIAAALGALVGAGPRFKLVIVRNSSRP